MNLASPWWNWSSPVWVVAVAIGLAYAIATRGFRRGGSVPLAIGLVLLVAAFVSPLGVLANGVLFSAHMVQHLLLLLVVPLCLVLALPEPTSARARNDVAPLGSVAAAACWILGVGAMWFWHVPTLCSAATSRPALGLVRDGSLLLAGCAFWWPILAPCRARRLPPLNGIAFLFSACLGCTLLGIYVTFTTVSVCPAFATPTGRIELLTAMYDAELTPVVDQHLGGLLMWVPPCILYVSMIIGQLARWYSVTERVDPVEIADGGVRS